MIERNGIRLGFLSYNCVGPRESWAGPNRAGCAYVHVLTHYELDHASPGGPPDVYTFAEPHTLDAMIADIEALRSEVDAVVVALHKGLGHTPATVGMYERQVAKAAIDAGADIVVGHHAHILQGMEVYRNRPIFHGLGNFAIATKALNIDGNSSPERRAWAERRRKLFGFEPDPEYRTYPFHPEAKNAIIAYCEFDREGDQVRWIHPLLRQPAFSTGSSGRLTNVAAAVARYVEDITRRAGSESAIPVGRRPRAVLPEKQSIMSNPRPLEDITVLDLTTALAGPYATFLLAGLGARVIKIENPAGPDTCRANAPYLGPDGPHLTRQHPDDVSVSAINRLRNKQAVTLNMKHPESRAIFEKLVRKADMLVENFSRGVLDRLGAGYADVHRINPRLLYCSITGFGSQGEGSG